MSKATIDHCISELLFEHECVIIPRFGGLVANREPARVNQRQHRFNPPAKKIGFNRKLVNNDGLLANHLAQQESIGYSEAVERIVTYVQGIEAQLKETKSYRMAKVGTFYIDFHGNYRFEPNPTVNYLLDAFGLTSFHSLPIPVAEVEAEPAPELKAEPEIIAAPVIVSEPVKKPEPEFVDRPPVEPERKRRRGVVYVPLTLLLLLLVGYLIWIPTNSGVFQGDDFQMSDLNPFSEKVCADYSVLPGGSEDLEVPTTDNDRLRQLTESATTPSLRVHLFDAGEKSYDSAKPVRVSLVKSEVAVPVTTRVAPGSSPVENVPLRYHVVGGCFGVIENAEVFIGKMKKAGYDPRLIDFHKGLHRVSIQSFSNRREALDLLKQIQNDTHPGAWLLVKSI